MKITKSTQEEEEEQIQIPVINEPLLLWLSQNKLKYEKLGRGSCENNGEKNENVQRTNRQ